MKVIDYINETIQEVMRTRKASTLEIEFPSGKSVCLILHRIIDLSCDFILAYLYDVFSANTKPYVLEKMLDHEIESHEFGTLTLPFMDKNKKPIKCNCFKYTDCFYNITISITRRNEDEIK